MNSMKQKGIFFLFICIICFILYTKFYFEKNKEQKRQTSIIKNEKNILLKRYWLILKESSIKQCFEAREYLIQWNILCWENFNKISIIKKKLAKVIKIKHKDWGNIQLRGLDLFAEVIKKNATIIYMTTYENFKKMKWKLKSFSEEYLYALSNKTFSSDFYFGCLNSNEIQSYKYTICRSSQFEGIHTPAVVSSFSEKCDEHTPDIQVEEGFVPIVFEDSIYSKCSFPFLPLFFLESHPWFSSLNASCLATHLLRELGCEVGVHWSLKDYSNKYQKYFSEYCKNFLKEFPKCSFSSKSNECLLKTMTKKTNLPDVLKTFKKWFDFLKSERFSFVKKNKSKTSCSVVIRPPQKITTNSSNSWSILNYNISQQNYKDICKSNATDPYPGKSLIQNGDVMMLVLFNNPFYEVIPLLEIMYRPLYPFITYCGPNLPKSDLTSKYKFTFLTYSQPPSLSHGHNNYECLMKLLSLRPNFNGIFVISDDIFIKNNFNFVPRNQLWLNPIAFSLDITTMKLCSYNNCSFKHNWYWWDRNKSRLLNIKKKWNDLAAFDPFYNKTRKIMTSNSPNSNVFFGGWADLYYVPKKHFESFFKMSDLYMKERVFLEITIPSVFSSLDEWIDISFVKSYVGNGTIRFKPYTYLNEKTLTDYFFVHPVKLFKVFKKEKEFIKMFCGCIVPYLINNEDHLCDN